MHATPPTRTAKNCKSMVMVWSCPAFTDGWFLGLMVYDLASSAPCQTRERGNERPRRSERPGEARRASAAQSRNDDRNPCGTAAMLCLLSSRASVVRHFDPNVADKIPRTVDLTPGTADFGAKRPTPAPDPRSGGSPFPIRRAVRPSLGRGSGAGTSSAPGDRDSAVRCGSRPPPSAPRSSRRARSVRP